MEEIRTMSAHEEEKVTNCPINVVDFRANAVKNRVDFVFFFEVINGNPNGDPDSGNMPRIDWETEHGKTSDGCIKRKIRDYVQMVKEGCPGFDIYYKMARPLDIADRSIMKHVGIDEANIKSAKKSDPDIESKIRRFVCMNYFDCRAFGATMTTFGAVNNLNCGQLRGPVQIGLPISVDPIEIISMTIARTTQTKSETAEQKGHITFGKRHYIPYAIYRVEGTISATTAMRISGFSEADKQLLWQAILHMFDDVRSANSGLISTRKLVIFNHESPYGNALSQNLANAIHIQRKDPSRPARCFEDYDFWVDEDAIPDGVTLQVMER